jgi:hypothetical protein
MICGIAIQLYYQIQVLDWNIELTDNFWLLFIFTKGGLACLRSAL